jgi:hypothetical protein
VANLINFRWKNGEKKSLQITIFFLFLEEKFAKLRKLATPASKKTHWGTRGRKKPRASSHSQQARQEVARTRIVREIEEDLVTEKNPTAFWT